MNSFRLVNGERLVKAVNNYNNSFEVIFLCQPDNSYFRLTSLDE